MSKKVFILTELMRSSKSGFFIQGTDIQMDYPEAYPLPMETEVLENGSPVALRLLPGCAYLEKDKQIKNGFPTQFKWKDADRRRITFIHRRLELDEKRDKIYLEYIERTAWKEGNEDKKPRDTTKTIYQEYDEDAILDNELEDESLVMQAKNLVFSLGDSDVRNLYRLANPGRNDGLIRIAAMKKTLLDISNVNPAFIINGIKTNRDKLVVLISRAIEANIINLQFPGTVALFNPQKNDWENLLNVSDLGGPEDKFDRLIDYLTAEEGATDLAVIEKRLSEADNPQPQLEEKAAAKPVRKR